MNKIILYVGLAILLGTVTMVAPLALLQDNSPLSDDKYIVKTTGGTLENQTRNDYQTLSPEAPSDMLETPAPSESDAKDVKPLTPEEPEIVGSFTSKDSDLDLSPVALITVPSFLVALGMFVILRRQA